VAALRSRGAGLAVAVDGGTIEGTASTVIDTTTTPWRALREGPIPAADVIGSAPTLL
jgi:tRNA A37 threonylcarbamoyladenosine synthetase subunit TsaC/SUA5/YrdC